MLTREKIISELKTNKQQFRDKLGIEELGLFGSYARVQESDASDIDIIVKLKEPIFSSVASLMRHLENKFGKEVHVTTKGKHLSRRFLSRIEKEVIYV